MCWPSRCGAGPTRLRHGHQAPGARAPINQPARQHQTPEVSLVAILPVRPVARVGDCGEYAEVSLPNVPSEYQKEFLALRALLRSDLAGAEPPHPAPEAARRPVLRQA